MRRRYVTLCPHCGWRPQRLFVGGQANRYRCRRCGIEFDKVKSGYKLTWDARDPSGQESRTSPR